MIQTEGFKYLGVYITRDPDIAKSRNLMPVLDQMVADMCFWEPLPLSLLGRAAIFKMVCLPRLLYQLQNFPFPIAAVYFSTIETHLRGFLWQHGVVRIALTKCYKSTFDGGIALPDILAYYRAAQLVVLNEWWFGGARDPAYASEFWAMGDTSIQQILYGTIVPSELPPAARTVFAVWRSTLRSIKWHGKLTEESPLWEGTMMPQVAGLRGFRRWDLIGISKIGHVTQNGIFKSFTDLSSEYGLHRSQFCKYLQLRHAITPYLAAQIDLPEHNPLEAKVLLTHIKAHKISHIYKTLVIHTPTLLHLLNSHGWLTYQTLPLMTGRRPLCPPGAQL